MGVRMVSPSTCMYSREITLLSVLFTGEVFGPHPVLWVVNLQTQAFIPQRLAASGIRVVWSRLQMLLSRSDKKKRKNCIS